MKILLNLKKPFLLFFLFHFFLLNGAFGTDYFFTGTGNYTDTNLWTPSYPGTNITTGNTVTITAGSECFVATGTFLFITGLITNNGTMEVANFFGCFTSGHLINNGTFHTITTIDNLGDITNHGELIVEGNFSSQGQGNFVNAATGIFVNHNSFIASDINGNTHIFEGLFKGTGVISVDDYQNEGTINPGFSPGIITFEQNLSLGNSGTLQIEIAGNAGPGLEGGHDQIEVLDLGSPIGDLAIDGTLEVILLDDFTPDIGDQWTIATGTTSGAFAHLILPAGYTWNVDIQATNIVVSVIAISLPVELADFAGSAKEGSVHLSWLTHSELDNEGWNIEHSGFQTDWETIGFVKGKGNTIDDQTYTFIHETSIDGDNYYRLQQLDFDGKTVRSSVIHIPVVEEETLLEIYPNPTNDRIFFSRKVEQVEIVDGQGKMIVQTQITNGTLDLNFLANGVYFIKSGEQLLKVFKN